MSSSVKTLAIFTKRRYTYKDPDDGITYKILINDIRISRYVDMDIVGVNDIVVVYYEGKLNENVIDKAASISKGIISGVDVLIPE